MRNFIKIVEGDKVTPLFENADSDDMYGDAPTFMRTLANYGAQEFTDKGRADIPSKPNNPRFSDNSMTAHGLDEDDEAITLGMMDDSSENISHMDKLHNMLTRTGLTDLEIRQGVKLGDKGKMKIAGELGIAPEEVDLMINSLIQTMRDEDNHSTDALLDDYMSFMNEEEKEGYPHTQPSGYVRDTKKEPKKTEKDEPKKKVDEGFEPGVVYHIQHKDGERSFFIPTHKQKNGRHAGLQWDQGASGRSNKKPTKSSYEHGPMWKETPHNEIPAHVKADVRETITINEFKNTKNNPNFGDNPFQKGYNDYKKHVPYGKPDPNGEWACGWRKAETEDVDSNIKSNKKSKVGYKRGMKETNVPNKENSEKVEAKSPKKSKSPFDKGIMERFSYERDSTGNVTVRDSETGKEKYLQGSQAANVLYKLDHGANEQEVLSPLLEELVDNHESDYEKEIAATAGTYNFPWVYKGKHGFATAFYNTDSNTPNLKINGVRNMDGNEIDIDSAMEHALLSQAEDFIGEE